MCTKNCGLKAYYMPGTIKHYENLSKGQNLERLNNVLTHNKSDIFKSWSSSY